jgi:hypothetical protein
MIRAASLWRCAAVALALSLSVAEASALPVSADTTSSVLASQSLLVQGSAVTNTTLKAPGAGELFLTLTDLQFPTSFASLQFALTDASSTLVGMRNSGTMSIDLTAPMTVYADVFATTQGGFGLYNLSATFVSSSAVPLPGGAVSLASGCMLLLWFWLSAERLAPRAARRSGSTQATVTTPVA